MKFILLTHATEITKSTNTGRLVQQHVPGAEIIIWQRTQPDENLLKLITSGNTALVYPATLHRLDDQVPEAGSVKHLAEKNLSARNLSARNSSVAGTVTDISSIKHFVLIDSTWQQARKIFNRSPYLQQLPTLELSSAVKSNYHLRRNQMKGGLCTVECVIELLRMGNHEALVTQLEQAFNSFLID